MTWDIPERHNLPVIRVRGTAFDSDDFLVSEKDAVKFLTKYDNKIYEVTVNKNKSPTDKIDVLVEKYRDGNCYLVVRDKHGEFCGDVEMNPIMVDENDLYGLCGAEKFCVSDNTAKRIADMIASA